MKKRLVIFGAGQIAQIAKYYFDNDSDYTPVAFAVDAEFRKADEFEGLPLLDFETIESSFPPAECEMFIALSYSGMNRLRAEKYEQCLRKGYQCASYISSQAFIAKNATVGRNCFILEDNTIQPFVRIGNNVTLWSGNHIGHHSEIKDHCFVSSHVVISGGVVVNPYCFVGVNATLRDHIIIAESNLIGAGALILNSTGPDELYIGEPAKLSKVPSTRVRNI
jgi:sugar O-acyltransferase (sialic acid O-acetyltransferase NeuD family)